jgi:hypothetical protein
MPDLSTKYYLNAGSLRTMAKYTVYCIDDAEWDTLIATPKPIYWENHAIHTIPFTHPDYVTEAEWEILKDTLQENVPQGWRIAKIVGNVWYNHRESNNDCHILTNAAQYNAVLHHDLMGSHRPGKRERLIVFVSEDDSSR